MIIFVIEMIQLEMIAMIKENDAQPEVVTEVSATHELKEEAHWLSHGTHLRAVSYFPWWQKKQFLEMSARKKEEQFLKGELQEEAYDKNF